MAQQKKIGLFVAIGNANCISLSKSQDLLHGHVLMLWEGPFFDALINMCLYLYAHASIGFRVFIGHWMLGNSIIAHYYH
jgi:hypothetical protein